MVCGKHLFVDRGGVPGRGWATGPVLVEDLPPLVEEGPVHAAQPVEGGQHPPAVRAAPLFGVLAHRYSSPCLHANTADTSHRSCRLHGKSKKNSAERRMTASASALLPRRCQSDFTPLSRPPAPGSG